MALDDVEEVGLEVLHVGFDDPHAVDEEVVEDDRRDRGDEADRGRRSALFGNLCVQVAR